MSKNKLLRYLNDDHYVVKQGIYCFESPRGHKIKLNRTNVLEELAKGRIWKNVYAHYFRLVFILKWLKPNRILVDVGCGRGWLMDIIYRNRAQVSYIGIDLSETSLLYSARKKYGYPRLLIQTNCLNLPLIDEFANYVVCYEVIEHNTKKDAQKIIGECRRILKRNGLFFISTPISHDGQMIFPKDHIYEWSFAEIKMFLQDVGFEILNIFGCFGKSSQILNKLNETEKEIYLRFSKYFTWHVLSAFFSILHPESAQGVILLCRKL